MTQVNPNKLIRNFQVETGNPQEIRLNWNMPVDYEAGEEIVITRRKDAFPVELRNPNYEDRYTDVAQIEIFRGSTIYLSQLIVDGNKLVIGSSNQFTPNSVTEFDVTNKYTGRLIRDEAGNVFKITDNTETEIFYENIQTREDLQVIPRDGAFVVLAEFPKEIDQQQTISLLADSNTVRIDSNTFDVGDKLTINNTVELTVNEEWEIGTTPQQTARNIRNAIINSGVRYQVEVYDEVILIEQGQEETLAVESNNSSLLVNNYGISGNQIFIDGSLFSKNRLRDQVVVFGTTRYFVKYNEGKEILLYNELNVDELPNIDFTKLSSFNNGQTSPLFDRYKSYLEVLTKKPTGLNEEKYYYYTGFNTPKRSTTIFTNEDSSNPDEQLDYTVDKVGTYISRVFYEDIQFPNKDLLTFTYNATTGVIEYDGNPDLSEFDIQVGDTFGDSSGSRFLISDVSDLANGRVTIPTGQTVNTQVIRPTHALISRPNTPTNFDDVEVDDTFLDIAGNSFRVVGTVDDPRSGVLNHPANAIDVLQGLIDSLIVRNDLIVPFTFDPETSTIQYGQRSIALNRLLASFTYNSMTGIVQYSGTSINLVPVAIGDRFRDGAGNLFEILEVNQANQTVTLETGLTIDNTVDNDRDGSIIRVEGFTDIEGNLLIDLSEAEPNDLLKVAGGATYDITSVDAPNARLTIDPTVLEVSTTVEDPFSGSVIRRGVEVSWIGIDGELDKTLQNLNQGGVKRYTSVYQSQAALFNNPLRTQAFAISTQDRQFGNYLYNLFPRFFRVVDETGDLEDIMKVFGNQFNQMFSVINTYELQNANLIPMSPLRNAARSKGFNLTSETLGIDTRRRIVRDLQNVYRKKGTRQGIFEFIKVLTTWDITNGTGDIREAIIDDSPEAVGLKFYSSALGDDNTRLVDTLDVQSPPAGRFYKGLPGITLPGFFEFTEVIITLPNIALEIGNSTGQTFFQGETTISDDSADFGLDNSLVGTFIIPNEGNSNDFYEVIANTKDTITVRGSVPDEYLGAKYVVLSPLNLNRFISLTATIDQIIPFNTIPVFVFTLTT